MFCPKCGTQNPETGKFCRSCGTDLGNVSAALTKNVPAGLSVLGTGCVDRKGRPRDKNDLFVEGVRSTIFGVGFLVIAAVLFFTNVAGGNRWWWAMLFPAFAMLAKGISEIIRYGMIEGDRHTAAETGNQRSLNQPEPNASLPPSQTEYVSPDSRFKTGDLVPPSVTDNTTRHLEINSEGKTMTLPKK